MLFLDRVYAGEAASSARFRWVNAPTSAELTQLTHTVAHRLARYLERQGLLERDAEHGYLTQKNDSKSIVGYGATGKGNTLLNYCGIREDFLDYTIDLSPHKQNTYTPGTRIPVYSPNRIKETKPDFVFILPWNLKDEIVSQHSYINEWGGRFVVPIPEVTIF